MVATLFEETEIDTAAVRDVQRRDARWWPVEGERLPRLESVDIAEQVGLFLDSDFVSAYHVDPATGEYF